jgi:hypothetical protein
MSSTEETTENPMKKKKPSKPDKSHRVRVEPYTDSLLCDLTREEVEAFAQKAGELLQQKDAKEDEFSEKRKAMKSELKTLTKDFRVNMDHVRTRQEFRQVACRREFDFDANRVREVREDNGVVMSDRPMTEDEKHEQGDLFQPEGEPEQGGTGGGDLDDEFGG